MRHWGLVVSGYYGLILFGILAPGMIVLMRLPLAPGEGFEWWALYASSGGGLFAAIWGSILVGGQALLLFLSVDTAWRRAKPRQHIAISAALTGFFFAILAASAAFSFALAAGGEDVFDGVGKAVVTWTTLILWLSLWIGWGIVFYRFGRGASETLDRAVSWLLRGSVLELLVAVPAHVIVRSRDDCSAPVVTSWGIVTGIAVMLMCFGPGVLALYRKRIDAYGARRAPGLPASGR